MFVYTYDNMSWTCKGNVQLELLVSANVLYCDYPSRFADVTNLLNLIQL